MAAHEWSRVSAGDFHDFHQSWAVEIRRALNMGVLPDGYSAQVERYAGRREADVLTLRGDDAPGLDGADGVMTLADALPKVHAVDRAAKSETDRYAALASRVRIDRIRKKTPVAFIEIVSPGNKDRDRSVASFLDRMDEILDAGCHLLLIDVLRPTPSAADGMHAAFWRRRFDDLPTETDIETPLCFASYRSMLAEDGDLQEAFVTPLSVGAELPSMPVFLSPEKYVTVPLGETYDRAWEATPADIRAALQGPS